jgi:hypothetical protein
MNINHRTYTTISECKMQNPKTHHVELDGSPKMDPQEQGNTLEGGIC